MSLFLLFLLFWVALVHKRRRDKTSEEFGDALMCYLGRKAERSTMEYTTFQHSLRELAQF